MLAPQLCETAAWQEWLRKQGVVCAWACAGSCIICSSSKQCCLCSAESILARLAHTCQPCSLIAVCCTFLAYSLLPGHTELPAA